MYSPRSRNWVAYEDGTDSAQSGAGGVPPKDYCYYCLNTKAADEICGVGGAQSYDNWLDAAGNPMPWNSQATYTEGDIIEIKSNLHTPHWGHQDVMVCADGDASTQECFEQHPLEFIEDLSYGAPKDPNYPNRGHFTGAYVDFSMKFRLPMGVTGDKVMMQWRYVTANNCWPPGYEDYPYDDAKGGNSLECSYPLDPTGAVGTGKPEQFWNCAEITILPSGPTTPTTPMPTPPTPPTSPTSPPVSTPTGTGPACCSWPPYEQCSQPDNVWCHESQNNCEGSCSGKWLGGDAPQPTNAPVLAPSSPVALPTPTVPQPTNSNGDGRGCCSINFKTCHHDVGTFCWETEENCRGPCGKYWLPTGEISGCAAQWEACTHDDDCCGPTTCASDGTCLADGWNYTADPTKSPASSPTTPAPVPVTVSPVSTSPTASPSLTPTIVTISPTIAPVNGDVDCCTWDLYHCGVDDWCNESKDNCHVACGGVWMKKTNPAMECIAKYKDCTGEVDVCCGSLTCRGNEHYKQCL